ncbi:hypothetical protein [Treponema denticola]|uniref:hypothetical protein n=1 Tax=Treponema denticola TaxID=158 RepID=UPI0020A26255|nr:hypothetical protein [Treponema denticola]UTC86879.1 hypothetical protein E4N79_01435 [Treponema denticola]
MIYYIILVIFGGIGSIVISLFLGKKIVSSMDLKRKRRVLMDYHFIKMVQELNPEKNFDFIIEEFRKEVNSKLNDDKATDK